MNDFSAIKSKQSVTITLKLGTSSHTQYGKMVTGLSFDFMIFGARKIYMIDTAKGMINIPREHISNMLFLNYN